MSITFPRAHRLVACALVLLAIACSKDRPAPAPPAAPPPAAPAQDPVGLVPLPPDKAAGEITTFRLSMEGIRAWGKAQLAVTTALDAHPEIVSSIKQNQPHSFDEMIGMFSGNPVLAAAIKRSGTTPHDFVLTMISLNQAVQGYQRVRAGQQVPPNAPPAIAANIALVEKNLPEIDQIYASLKK